MGERYGTRPSTLVGAGLNEMEAWFLDREAFKAGSQFRKDQREK